jgi:geranylgeranyl pyrophosphate synthase
MSDPLSQLQSLQQRIEKVLDHYLALDDCGTARLREAMRYSALAGGKRLRPLLVYSTATSLGASLETVDAAAAAVELIHVYSLVHDDLPAMDNDDWRRGKPTCHRAFDEGTAMLAGDALQALAFKILAESCSDLSATQQLTMVRLLAQAAGTAGMAGGQAIDLESVGVTLDTAAVENMHRRKTGALIVGSVLLGAVGANVLHGRNYEALQQYAQAIGLAFQIQDDILDVEGDPQLLGKAVGVDAARRKPTYPGVAGVAAACARAVELRDQAVAALEPLGAAAHALTALAHYMVDRRN